jgi:hypothetical protein
VIYRFNNGPDHFLTTQFEEGLGAGYFYEGIAFRIYSELTPQTQPLYRCNNYSTGDHFASLRLDCEGKVLEGLYGYVGKYARPGLLEIQRFINPTATDHLETLNGSEGHAAGWTFEGPLG